MANKFKVWVDSPGSVIMDAATFDKDFQRTSGFQAGQAASALRVNSALRQANLVVAALMGLVDNDNLDLKSSVTDVSQGINTWLTNKITNTTVTNASNATNATNVNIISDSTVGNNVVKFQIGSGTYNKTINNVQNATNATNATNAVNAIKNYDDTFSGFQQTQNGQLKVGDFYIEKKKLIWSGDIQHGSFANVSEDVDLGDELIFKFTIVMESSSYPTRYLNNILFKCSLTEGTARAEAPFFIGSPIYFGIDYYLIYPYFNRESDKRAIYFNLSQMLNFIPGSPQIVTNPSDYVMHLKEIYKII